MSDFIELNLGNKPCTERSAKLKIEFVSGFLLDWNKFIPGHNFDKIDVSTIQFDIFFDNNLLWTGTPQGVTTSLIVDFVDSSDHVLEFYLNGIEHYHMPSINQQEHRFCIQIKSITIENFEIMSCLYASNKWQRSDGTEYQFPPYIADNGKSIFTFQKPIYRWLLDRHTIINNQKHI
jgi:hypothetical protein